MSGVISGREGSEYQSTPLLTSFRGVYEYSAGDCKFHDGVCRSALRARDFRKSLADPEQSVMLLLLSGPHWAQNSLHIGKPNVMWQLRRGIASLSFNRVSLHVS